MQTKFCWAFFLSSSENGHFNVYDWLLFFGEFPTKIQNRWSCQVLPEAFHSNRSRRCFPHCFMILKYATTDLAMSLRIIYSLIVQDRVIAHKVNCRPLNTKDWVWSVNSLCMICITQGRRWGAFLSQYSVFSCQLSFHQCSIPIY